MPVHGRSIAADASPRDVTVGSPGGAAHLPLPSPSHRPRGRAGRRGDRVELDRAARAARRRIRARARRRSRASSTRSRSRAAPRRSTSRSSCSASARATRSRAPTLTFAASANAVVYTGATPFFVDCDEATLDAGPGAPRPRDRGASVPRADDVRRPSSPSTSTASAATTTRSARCARATTCLLVQDAAEALGATYKRRARPAVGRRRGVLVQRQQDHHDERRRHAGARTTRELVEHARSCRRRPASPAPHYEHVEVGFNYRLSNLLAALGRGQLESLAERVATRRAIRRRATAEALARRRRASRSCPRREYGTATRWLTVHRRSTRPSSAPTGRRSGSQLEARRHRGAAALEADAPPAGLRDRT